MKITIEEVLEDSIEVVNIDEDNFLAEISYSYEQVSPGRYRTRVHLVLEEVQIFGEQEEEVGTSNGEDPEAYSYRSASQSGGSSRIDGPWQHGSQGNPDGFRNNKVNF